MIVENDIKIIIDASKDNLFYLCTETGHMPSDQQFPIFLCNAETAAIEDWNGIDRKRTRVYDVTMSILEKKSKVATIDNGKGGTTRESELAYNLRLAARRKELVGIFERVVHYLTDSKYRFYYNVVSDMDFDPISNQRLGNQKNGLEGMLCTVSIAAPTKLSPCCVDFDEDAIINR